TVPVRADRLAVQRRDHGEPARRGRPRARRGGGRRGQRADLRRAGRGRDPAGRARRRGNGSVRRDRLPRVRDPGRDATFRLHLLVRRARHHGGGGRHRRADGVRSAHDEHARAGGGTRRAERREQGARGRRGGHRDGGPVQAAVVALWSGRVSSMTVFDAAARHRAREAALQMLYQWEVGRVPPQEAVRTYWPGRDAPPSPDDEHADAAPEAAVDEHNRTWANALVAGTIDRLKEADELIAAHTRNWRLERMAVIDRLILRMAI